MSFSEQPFSQRYTVLGDTAEAVYEKVKPLGNTLKFGYRRPKGIRFSHLPPTVRHQPDFITPSHLVEVVGLGRDGILKSIKTSKYEALKVWNKIAKEMGLLGLVIFVWNSHKKTFLVLAWSDIVQEVAYSKRKHGLQTFKNDGNTYYRLDWERLLKRAVTVGTFDE